MWAFKGLFKAITVRVPPGTESDDSLSGMGNGTEERNNERARIFIKNQEQLFARKKGNNTKAMLNKRKAACVKGNSNEAKVREVVARRRGL